MSNPVVIKANKYGLSIVMDDKCSFDEIKQAVLERFNINSKFFESSNIAISFEGRILSKEEELELIDLISDNTDINIKWIVDGDENKTNLFKNTVQAKEPKEDQNSGQFVKGTFRSGQVYEQDCSIVVLGDVNPGATVISKGNIVILGNLQGSAFAGADGNENSFVVALEMNPQQIKIGHVLARCNDITNADKKAKDKKTAKILEPKIAYLEGNSIYIDTLDKNILQDIKL